MKLETAVPVGQGAMGEVFKAWDPQLQRHVAVKLLHRADPESLERMLREARSQALVDHPNVCKVYEVGENEEGRPYISMQLVEGEPLDKAAADLSIEEKIHLMVTVADAVQAAHAVGLIHRDLKPSNILVERDGHGQLRPYVLDFGIAREFQTAGLTVTGQVVGTPAYMSPEQARGEVRTLDRRSDVFSLGVILFELLAGRSPYSSDSGVEQLIAVLQTDPPPLRRVAPFVPRDLETIVATCLEKDPDQRYPSAREFANDLTRYLNGESIAARRSAWTRRTLIWIRRHRMVASLATIVVIGAPSSALKYTLDMRAERSRALAASSEAESLMDFMLEDLHQRLEPLGRTDLLEEVARRALAHHDRFSASDRTPASRHRRALAYKNLGLVLESQGDLDAAERSLHHARELLATVAAEQPDRVRWLRDLAGAESEMAGILLERGDTEGSSEACRGALATARSLVARFGQDDQNLAELWRAAANTTWLHHQRGQLDLALEASDEALAVASERVTSDPDANEWLYRLSVTKSYRGMVQEEQQRHDLATTSYREALALADELAHREPHNARWTFESELCNARLGHVLEHHDDFVGAELKYRAALDLARELVARDEANAKWRRELSVALTSLGQVLRRLDRTGEALPLLDESLSISRRLAVQDPTNASLKNDLAWDLVQVGTAYSELGDDPKARSLWEAALVVITPLAESTDLAWYRDTQVIALLNLGRVEEARPLAERLLAAGWDEAEFLELVRRHELAIMPGLPEP